MVLGLCVNSLLLAGQTFYWGSKVGYFEWEEAQAVGPICSPMDCCGPQMVSLVIDHNGYFWPFAVPSSEAQSFLP